MDACELQILSILLDFLNSHCSAAHVAPQRLGQIFAPPLLHVPEGSDPQEPSSPMQEAAPSVISLMISHVHVLFAPSSLHPPAASPPHSHPSALPQAALHPASPPSIPIAPKPVPTRPVQASSPGLEAAVPASAPLDEGGCAGSAAVPLGLHRRPLRIRCPRSTAASGNFGLPKYRPLLPKCPAEGLGPVSSSLTEVSEVCAGAAALELSSSDELGQPAVLVSDVDAMLAETLQRVLFCV